MTRPARLLTILLLAACLVPPAGCIRSRLLVASEPSGANVKFDNEDYGQTPVEIPFIWYWHHRVELTKEGYEPLATNEYLRTPPWFIFPLDFFAELIPVPIYDTRERSYVLKPLAKADSEPTTGTALPAAPAAVPAVPAPGPQATVLP